MGVLTARLNVSSLNDGLLNGSDLDHTSGAVCATHRWHVATALWAFILWHLGSENPRELERVGVGQGIEPIRRSWPDSGSQSQGGHAGLRGLPVLDLGQAWEEKEELVALCGGEDTERKNWSELTVVAQLGR